MIITILLLIIIFILTHRISYNCGFQRGLARAHEIINEVILKNNKN